MDCLIVSENLLYQWHRLMGCVSVRWLSWLLFVCIMCESAFSLFVDRLLSVGIVWLLHFCNPELVGTRHCECGSSGFRSVCCS